MALGKSRIFLIFCLSFALGVGLARFLNYPIMAVMAMIFITLTTVWWTDKRARVIGFAGLILLLGAVRYQTSFPYDDPNFIGKYYGQEVEVEGIVIREPDTRSDKVNLTVKPTTSPQPSPSPGEGELVGNILLNIGKYPEYQYGDKLKISGKVEEPFVSEEFSYKDYLSRYDTYAVMRFPKIERIGEGQGSPIKAALLTVKHKFQDVLSEVLPEPHNALALGLILGAKRAIPEDLKNAMIAVGVSHIVVISGYNMSILTRNISGIRNWIGRRGALLVSLLLVLAFVVMTGADASVVRAAIMAMLAVVALNLGRIYVSLNALVFVGVLMVLQNPKILNFDVGFQLSFLATLGLIYLAPVFERWFERVPNIFSFRDNLAATLSAQIFTLPLLIYYFDRLSIVSPLVNILILWTVPYAMFFAFLTGLAGLVFLPAGKIIAALLWAVLQTQIWIVEFFARLPFAQIAIGIPMLAIFIYYLSLLWKLRRLPRENLLIFTHDTSEEAKI